MHPPSLHHTLKPFPFAVTPRIDELTLHKPIRLYLFAHRQQALVIRNSKLLQVPLGRHPLDRVMAQHGFGKIPLIPDPVTDTDGKVAMSLPCFVADDLDSIQLQDRTRCAHTALAVKHGCHALFDS